MNLEQYKKILLGMIRGFTKPMSFREIIECMKFPENDREVIEEAIKQLLLEGKIKIFG